MKTELVLPRSTVEKVKGVAEETLEGVARKVLSAALERRRSQGRMQGLVPEALTPLRKAKKMKM